MRIHAKFTVKNAPHAPCRLIAYFYYDDGGPTPLKAGDADHRDAEGNVSAHVDFTPESDATLYEDSQIFIPYNSLKVESGKGNQLKFYLAFLDKSTGKFFGRSGWYKFSLTAP